MKEKKTKNITAAIFLGLVLGILFGLFMPGRYDFLLPAVELISFFDSDATFGKCPGLKDFLDHWSKKMIVFYFPGPHCRQRAVWE